MKKLIFTCLLLTTTGAFASTLECSKGDYILFGNIISDQTGSHALVTVDKDDQPLIQSDAYWLSENDGSKQYFVDGHAGQGAACIHFCLTLKPINGSDNEFFGNLKSKNLKINRLKCRIKR